MISSGLLTLDNIAFHQLMPWLESEYEDSRHYEILRITGYAIKQDRKLFFKSLISACHTLNLPLSRDLQQEWEMFAALQDGKINHGISDMLLSYRHGSHKVRFYILLTGYTIQSSLLHIGQTLERWPGADFRKYFITRTLGRLEANLQMHTADKSEVEEHLLVIKIQKLGVIAIYLELSTKYKQHIEPKSLRMNPQQVFDMMVTISMADCNLSMMVKTLKSLYQRYFLNANGTANQNGNKGRTGTQASKSTDFQQFMQLMTERQKPMLDGQNSEDFKPSTTTASPENPGIQENQTSAEKRIGSGEAMQILGVCKTTLKTYRDQGRLAFAQPVTNGKITYLRKDVEELMKSRGSKKE